jgi:hypothetical protein
MQPSSAPTHPEQVRALEFIARKGTQAPVETLRSQLAAAFRTTEELFATVAPAERSVSPAPGKWSPHEILDHLVVSHRPALPQIQALLAGTSPEGVAIPAGLTTPATERPDWDALLRELKGIHRDCEALAEGADDSLSLEPKAVVEMVVKVAAGEGEPVPVHWHERFDWKAMLQIVRAHTLEHRGQLERALGALRSGVRG